MKLTFTEVSYLLKLLRLKEENQSLSTGKLAEAFSVKPSSAIDVLKKLEIYGLIKRNPWRSIELTKKGNSLALEIIHNHRTLEVYFKEVLGLKEEICCKEASKIDYLLSREVINSICKLLGYPNYCIHGKRLLHKWCI
ncbi:Iron-dependent repressor IdeR [archaeon HR06]|nr:Iron-dependent repressor IdeR [archaeon HR06]